MMIKMYKFMIITACLFLTCLPNQAKAAVYEIDGAHSQIGFAVKHLIVSKTRGAFSAYSGSVEYDPNDLSTFHAQCSIDANSIDTNNTGRDNHLKGTDFLDTASFPQITFQGTQLTASSGSYQLTGDLTIRGITQKITLDVEISGPIASPFGGDVIGISGTAKINRQDFGVKWNKAMDTGGFVVDDIVELNIDIEGHKKP